MKPIFIFTLKWGVSYQEAELKRSYSPHSSYGPFLLPISKPRSLILGKRPNPCTKILYLPKGSMTTP